MKIVLKGESPAHLSYKLEQVVHDVLTKMGIEEQVEDISIDANIIVNMKITGVEGNQLIFTDRVIMGQQEIFTVVPEYDADGNLVGSADNKDVTFEAVAKSLSQELPTEPIESEFSNEDLTFISNEYGGDIEEAKYNHKDGFMVVRYYRAGVGLVGELTAHPKQEG